MRFYSVIFCSFFSYWLFLAGLLFAQTDHGYVPRANDRYLIVRQAPMPPESQIVNPLSQRVTPLPDPALSEPVFKNPFQYTTSDHGYISRANNRYLIAQQAPKLPESQTITPFPDPDPALSEPVFRDPFQYRTSDGNIMMVPSRSSVLPQGIRVVGVLIMEDKNQLPIAAVQMPNISGSASRSSVSDTIHYVHEGEMLEVNRSMLNARSSARPLKDNGTQSETLFNEIFKITPYQIEVHSKDNFEDKHIIR
jgi:hypothetical protein